MTDTPQTEVAATPSPAPAAPAPPAPEPAKATATAKANPGLSAIDGMIAQMKSAEKENYVRDKLTLETEDEAAASEAAPEPEPFNPAAPAAPPMPVNYERQARLLVLFIDTAAGYTLNAYAGGPSMSHYQASDSDKAEMAKALAEGMAEQGVNFHIPWWVSFLFVAIIAYWPKFKEARAKHREAIDSEAIQSPTDHWEKARAAAAAEAEREKQQYQPPQPPAAPQQPTAQTQQPMVIKHPSAATAPKEPKPKRITKANTPNRLTCQLIGCDNALYGNVKKYCSYEHRMLGLNGHSLPQHKHSETIPFEEVKPE